MTGIRITLLRLVSSAAIVVAALCGASAQSTVFNIPSTDVQSAKRWYVEADFTAHLSSFERGGYQSYGPRIVYGLNRRMEVGFNAFYTYTAPAEPTEIQPNFKVKLYDNETHGVGVATGAIAFIPVTQRAESTDRAMIYAVASKSFKGDFGPRFTAGSYALVGSFGAGATKKGALVGYEQPISKRVTFVADWASGNNDYGYLVVGAGITLTSRNLLYVGYNFGNQGRANNSLGVYYGFSF